MDIHRRVRLALVLSAALAIGGPALPVSAQEAQATASDPPRVSGPWFEQLDGPVPLSRAELLRLGREVFDALRRGGELPETAFEFLPFETGARPLQLWWGSGNHCAVVGQGLQDALRRAAAQALASGAGGDRLSAVAVEIAQYALPYPEFLVRDTVLLQPSLLGLAFDRRQGFAFYPSQFLFSGYVSPQGTLAVDEIGAQLGRHGLWADLGAWNSLSTFAAYRDVSYFETQAVWADAERSVELFRCHPFTPSPQRADIRAALDLTAGFLARHCDDRGRIRPRLTGWLPVSRTLHAEAQAAYALLRAARVTGSAEWAAAGDRVLHRLARRAEPEPGDEQSLWLVDLNYADLDTQALAVLALLEYEACTEKQDLAPVRDGLIRYLLRQIQLDGGLVERRASPSGAITPAENPVAGPARTALVFVRLYEKTGLPVWYDHAVTAAVALLREHFVDVPMAELPRDAACTRLLDELFTFTRNPVCVLQSERLAGAVLAEQVTDPQLLDLVGGVGRSPELAPAVDLCRVLLAVHRLLADEDRDLAADRTRSGIQLALWFVVQGTVGPESAVFCTDAPERLGLVRLSLAGHEGDLALQAAAVLCLAEALERGSASNLLEPPPTDRGAGKVLGDTAERATVLPRILPDREALRGQP